MDEKSTLEPTQPNSAAAHTVTPQRISKLAIVGLVLGCMSLTFWLYTAIPSLICSIIALNMISKSEGKLSGKCLAIIGLCVSGLLLFVLFPILALSWPTR